MIDLEAKPTDATIVSAPSIIRSAHLLRHAASLHASPARPRSPRAWPALAAVILVAGVVGTSIAASFVAGNDAAREQRAFRASATGVASALQLALQHENDLIVSAGGFVAFSTGEASNREFADWAASVHALARYPELLGLGNSVVVPRRGLAAFAAQALRAPSGRLGPGGRFEVIPPGVRPFYCLSTGSISRSARWAFPAGFDFCTGSLGMVSMAARDSGDSAYLPISNHGSTFLSVLTPVYRGGATPVSVAARRAAFVGWVGMEIMPKVVLDRALLDHPGLTVVLRYRADSSATTFIAGRLKPGAQRLGLRIADGWTVTVEAARPAGGVFASAAASAVLASGVAASLLLAALLFVLATGRARAWRLVSEKTDELRHQALHDALTDLPNRALIMDRTEQLLARSRRNGSEGAALFVDLDEFKNVNDTLGHEAGDQLLKAVAARLGSSLRQVDTLGRMGGDEFVVLIDGDSFQVAPELVAERILEVMRQPFTLDATPAPIIVTTSVGIAVGRGENPSELLRNADVALYQAKAAGKNGYVTFRPEMETLAQHRFELEFDLRSALEQHQFHLVYQPIYELEALTPVAAEALIRWDHPTHGEIQPGQFVPLLESTGQIVDVGRWVLREACQQMAEWRRRGSPLTISVNVSGRQLDRDSIVDHVREALELSGLEPEALTIEITETALMRDLETTTRRLHELKALGVRLAIDDFGTGYSSLAHLQRFPVDCLKIDRAFTEAIHRSPESDALVHTLVQLGKNLGLTTLAEGIETTAQMDHLRAEDVNEVQGFLLARPLDSDALEAQLLAFRHEPLRPAAR